MRSGEAFQVFKEVKRVVLDKTGTITRGKPKVIEVVALGKADQREVLRLAAAAESASEHSLGQAIVERAHQEVPELPVATSFQAYPGEGIEAMVAGETVLVGTSHFLSKQGIDIAVQGKQRELEEQGFTVVLVAHGKTVIGLIGIGDAIKDDAAEAVVRMKATGMEPIMITGDNQRAARAIAAAVGINNVLAEVLPGGKAEQVRKFQEGAYRVAMVGDGINDAPALTQADVGIAIGTGTDIAIEAADIVLVGDRLNGVVDAYYIGKSSFAKTVQNVALAFAFNGIGIPAAMTGLLHPVWAMVAMAASVTTVLLNSFGAKLIPATKMQRGEERAQTLKLMVPTIHCEGCRQAIEQAVAGMPGVKSVQVDLEHKLVTVTLQNDPSHEVKVREAIRKAGHIIV